MPHSLITDPKPLVFVGSSRKDLRKFPKAVRYDIGVDLYAVQLGRNPDSAKPFRGLRGVMEIVERFDTDTWRVMYVASLGRNVYVLHCFKKKSKRGISTPAEEIGVVRDRYKEAVKLAGRE